MTFSLFNCFQVFISGTKSECRKVLETILKNRRLCSLLSPFFTPSAAPAEFIQLYEKVVKFLREDNSDMIFMLLTKVTCDSVLTLSLSCGYCCCFPVTQKCRALGALSPGGLEADRPSSRLMSSSSSPIPQLLLLDALITSCRTVSPHVV